MSGRPPVLPQSPPLSRSNLPHPTIIQSSLLLSVSPFLYELLDSKAKCGEEETWVTLLLPDVKYEELHWLLQCMVGLESYQAEKLRGLVQLLGIETKVQSPSEESIKVESHLEDGEVSYQDVKQDLVLNDDDDGDDEIFFDGKDTSENTEEIELKEGLRENKGGRRKTGEGLAQSNNNEEDYYELMIEADGKKVYHCKRCEYITAQRFMMQMHIR